MVPLIANEVVVVTLHHVFDELVDLPLGLQTGARRPKVAADALASPSGLDEQHRLLEVVAHHVTKLQLQPDAPRRTVTHRQLAPAFEVVDPHVVALDVLPVLVQVSEETLRLRRGDLVVQQRVNPALALHVRLTRQDEHLHRIFVRQRGTVQDEGKREKQNILQGFHGSCQS